MSEPFDDDEDEDHTGSECHHGVGFDEECEDCEIEIQLELEDDLFGDPDEETLRDCGYC